MDDAKRETRRKHDAELNRQVLAKCAEPGASVARVALSHGLNANLVHKWHRHAAGAERAAAPQCWRRPKTEPLMRVVPTQD